MPNKPKMAAEKPRRRVSVSRKQAQPEVPFDTQVAIEQAIASLDIEQVRLILLSQERQLTALRMIMFDFQTILRQETMKRSNPVTKERFNSFIRELRKTVEANVGDLAAEHSDKSEVNDGIQDAEVDDIIAETFGPLSDWALQAGPHEDPIGEEEIDEMEDTLERAVADTEDAERIREPGRGRRRR